MFNKFRTFTLIILCIAVFSGYAQEVDYRGFRLGLQFGGYLPVGNTANYFNGEDKNENNINYIMSQPAYRDSIRYYLNVSDTADFFVREFPQNMNYQITINPGLYGEYVFNKSTALTFEFNYMVLKLKDAISIEVEQTDEVLQEPDIRLFPIKGTEKRIYFNVGMRKNFDTRKGYNWYLNGGMNINNTKVLKSAIYVEEHEFSLINYYGNQVIIPGQSQILPVNQGGIGYGMYAGGGFMFHANSITFEPGIITHYLKVNLEGYKSFNPGFGIYLRFIFDGGKGINQEEE